MRWKCTCAYDGTDFDGWQRQPGGGAVQNHIESALTQVFDLPLQLHGSGRTDAGVHARCLLYTSPSPRDVEESRMPSSA